MVNNNQEEEKAIPSKEDAFNLTKQSEMKAIGDKIRIAALQKEYMIEMEKLTEEHKQILIDLGYDVKFIELMGGGKTQIRWK